MSTEIFSSGIDLDGRFLSVFVYDCLVTFPAFASFFFDPKDLIVTSFILKGGLNRRRQVLHLDLRFFVMRLGLRDRWKPILRQHHFGKVGFTLDRVRLGCRYGSQNSFAIPFWPAPVDRARRFARSGTRRSFPESGECRISGAF